MILVRNLQQLLSGNKILLILFVLIFSACGGSKPIQKIPNFEKPKKELTEEKEIEDSEEEVVEEPQEVIETVEPEEKWHHRIAVLLPFNTQFNDFLSMNDTISQKSRLALEFYEGIKMGVTELNARGNDIILELYDTKNNPLVVEEIASRLNVNPPDLIIGPLFNKNIAPVAKWAKENETFMVSPLAPASFSEENNPFIITVNPGIKAHMEHILDHMIDQRFEKVTMVIDSHPMELEMGNQFLDLVQQKTQNEGGTLRVNRIVFNDDYDDKYYRNYLIEDQVNVVFVPSMNEYFTNKVLNRFHSATDSMEVIMFGMPNWYKFKSVNLESLESLKLHITANYFIDEYDVHHQLMQRRYVSNVGALPSDIVFRAYDIMLYFGEVLHQYGPEFGPYLDELPEKHVYCGYEFGIGFNKNSPMNIMGPDFIENKYLNILKFENYQFNLLQP